MQTLLGVALPLFARRRWFGSVRPVLGAHVGHGYKSSRTAYLAALLALGRKWEAGR